jgi:hypothetical protein
VRVDLCVKLTNSWNYFLGNINYVGIVEWNVDPRASGLMMTMSGESEKGIIAGDYDARAILGGRYTPRAAR